MVHNKVNTHQVYIRLCRRKFELNKQNNIKKSNNK